LITSGLQLWLDADDMGSTAGVWKDKSGNGDNATAEGTPTQVSDVINGHSVVRFDGGDSYSTPLNVANFDPRTNSAFVVFRESNTGNQSLLYLGNYNSYSPNWHWWGLSSQSAGVKARFGGYDGTIDSSVNSTNAIDTNKTYLVSTVTNTSSMELWIDGASQGAATTPSPSIDSATYMRIGRTEAYTDMFVGDIAQIVVYNRALSSSERGHVESFLNAKMAVATPEPGTIALSSSALLGMLLYAWRRKR
jgi:hypothetical protein